MLNISIHGAEELERKLSEIDIRRITTRWIRKGTLILQRQARIEAPVDTGNLRNQIHYTNMAEVGYVRAKAPYSIYVHEGTRFIKSNPFMERAIADKELDVITMYKRDLANHIAKIGLT